MLFKYRYLTLEQALAVFDYDLLNTAGLNAPIIGNALDDKCQNMNVY